MKATPSPVAAEKILRGIEKKSYHVFIGSDSIMMDKLSRLMPARAAKIGLDHDGQAIAAHAGAGRQDRLLTAVRPAAPSVTY